MKKIAFFAVMVSLLLVSVSAASAASGDLSWVNDLGITLTSDQKVGVPYKQYESLSDAQQDLISEVLTVLNTEPDLFSVANGQLIVSLSEVPVSVRAVLAVLNGSNLAERSKQGHEDSRKGLQIESYILDSGEYYWYTYQVKSSQITYPLGSPVKVGSRSLAWEALEPHTVQAGDETSWTFAGTLSISGGVSYDDVELAASIELGYSFTASVSMYISTTLNPGQKVDAFRQITYIRETIKYNSYYWEDWDYDGTPEYCLYVDRKSVV